MSAVTTKPDPIASIERIQGILARGDAGLAQLQGCERDLKHVLADAENEHEEIGSRRKIELLAHAPAAEIDKRLNVIEQRERAIARRLEISRAIQAQLVAKIDNAREEERVAKRQAAYDEARRAHVEATNLVRTFLDRVAPEAREVLQVYVESEAAVAAANKDLPPGASRIPSIEAERVGEHLQPKIIERHFKAFTCGRDYVCEVGAVEATPAAGGTWTLFLPSASVQGGSTVSGCVITDMVDLRIEKFESRRVESLGTALRVPPFYATAPERVNVEKKRMRLSEWRQINCEPVEAEAPLPRIVAE